MISKTNTLWKISLPYPDFQVKAVFIVRSKNKKEQHPVNSEKVWKSDLRSLECFHNSNEKKVNYYFVPFVSISYKSTDLWKSNYYFLHWLFFLFLLMPEKPQKLSFCRSKGWWTHHKEISVSKCQIVYSYIFSVACSICVLIVKCVCSRRRAFCSRSTGSTSHSVVRNLLIDRSNDLWILIDLDWYESPIIIIITLSPS